MTTLQHRGRCRLMLRMPAWRAQLRKAASQDFLEICEAYEMAWGAATSFANQKAAWAAEDFREIADALETEALYLAITAH